MRKATTTKKINETIANNLAKVEKAEVHYKSSGKTETIDAETFKKNLSFLCESGIFADAIGWHYERNYKTGLYEIETGRMNPDTEIIVTVYLSVGNGVKVEDIDMALSVVEEE